MENFYLINDPVEFLLSFVKRVNFFLFLFSFLPLCEGKYFFLSYLLTILTVPSAFLM